jgi:hypothetical protein
MIKHGTPQGSILGPLLFITYINDLPPTISTLSEPITFANVTGVMISSKKCDDFNMSNIALSQMTKWSSANKVALNLDKTNKIKFLQKIHPNIP